MTMLAPAAATSFEPLPLPRPWRVRRRRRRATGRTESPRPCCRRGGSSQAQPRRHSRPAKAIEHQIAEGAKAFKELQQNAALDWTHWSATILGMRALRTLAFAKAGTTNMRSQAYRDAIQALLTLRRYSIFDQIDRQTRSDCYKLMDRLEDVDAWYGVCPNR